MPIAHANGADTGESVDFTVRRLMKVKFNAFNVGHMPDTARLDECGMDDIDKQEILMELEEHYNIDFAHDAADKWQTVGDVVSSVRNLL